MRLPRSSLKGTKTSLHLRTRISKTYTNSSLIVCQGWSSHYLNNRMLHHGLIPHSTCKIQICNRSISSFLRGNLKMCMYKLMQTHLLLKLTIFSNSSLSLSKFIKKWLKLLCQFIRTVILKLRMNHLWSRASCKRLGLGPMSMLNQEILRPHTDLYWKRETICIFSDYLSRQNQFYSSWINQLLNRY